METYDVAVIGYGPTGATAANLLGQQGLRVAVIERDPDIYGRARAISTDEEVMRIWQSVGLADRLQADMMPNRPVAFVDADGIAFIESALAGGAAGHPAQQFLYQPVVDEVLRHGVERFGTVEILLEHECLRVADTDDGVELLLVDHRGDELRRLRARYVIAADGGSSPTRGQLGVSYSGRTYEERWIVIDTEIIQEWAGHDLMRFHCDPARPMVDCPTPLGHHRWEFPVQDDEDEGELLTDTAIWTLLRRRGIGPDNVKILRAVCYSHHVRVADRWRVGRVFLAGDAAHAMPPWIGQGMGAGVRDVANLCWKIAAVLRGEAPDRLLDSYQAERKPHVTEVTRRAVLVGRVINERRRWLATARNRGLRALSRVPGLVTWAQRFWWIPEARYRDGFFVGDHRAAGRQLPQPRVRRADGTAVRLDDLLGGRWTLLHLGAPPAGTAAWTARGVPALDLAAPDVSGVLTAWMHRYQATAVIVRPDGFVYAATQSGRPLPAPPIPAHTTIGVSA
ncbi:bifunctional 3-(3-hydroxy-phenyl)propionate/3-hydroxycinnamic acid hydroxylase [Mycolicibacterium fallax]|uniref:FAD-binding monooxygenase n=1 Tax=Mycolicibacterium fallax TaxID=1793 RepID=A0A1X1RGR4_MYCFA|nr:bifunctional 3-(3-hydroxy-phenyl)propionate/3-hydroxycinnamic acid hydroxylase [Mycolicibacterium fallax]ORV05564.1 FAD-binding monooxygenase [Mycolicibacterium fallax]